MRVFLETARSGSVSAAADRCALSQPAATQALKRLESDLGAPLLVRGSGGFYPTEAGALFVTRVEAALGHLRKGAASAVRGRPAARPGTRLDRHVTAAQLRTLIAIAGAGSFTVAARRLGLSQPTVHRAARGLEQAAGTPLFKATPAGVELTAPALGLVLGAKLAQAEIRQGLEEIAGVQGRERSRFVLGSLPLARSALVPKAINAMISALPGLQVRVIDGRYDELLRSLREGDMDCMIGALREPPPADDVIEQRLFDDALAIVAHPSHPLASRRGLTLEDTQAYPWVAPPKATPAGQYLAQELGLHERGETPVRLVSSSLVILRAMLAEGPYVSIISRHQIGAELRNGDMTVLDIALRGHRRPIGLTLRTDWRPTEAQARCIQYLRETAAADIG